MLAPRRATGTPTTTSHPAAPHARLGARHSSRILITRTRWLGNGGLHRHRAGRRCPATPWSRLDGLRPWAAIGIFVRHGAIVVRVFMFVWLRSPTAPRRILGIPEALKLHAARHFPEPGPASLAGDAALRRPRPAPRPRLPRRLRRATSRADQVGQRLAQGERPCTERLRETSTAGITGGRVNGGGMACRVSYGVGRCAIHHLSASPSREHAFSRVDARGSSTRVVEDTKDIEPSAHFSLVPRDRSAGKGLATRG